MLGYSTGSSGMNNQNAGGGVNINQNSFGSSAIGNINIGNTNQTGNVSGSGGTNDQKLDLKIPQGAGGAGGDAGKAGGAGEEASSALAPLEELAPLAAGLQNLLIHRGEWLQPTPTLILLI